MGFFPKIYVMTWQMVFKLKLSWLKNYTTKTKLKTEKQYGRRSRWNNHSYPPLLVHPTIGNLVEIKRNWHVGHHCFSLLNLWVDWRYHHCLLESILCLSTRKIYSSRGCSIYWLFNSLTFILSHNFRLIKIMLYIT